MVMLKIQPPTKGRSEYIRERFARNHGTRRTAAFLKLNQAESEFGAPIHGQALNLRTWERLDASLCARRRLAFAAGRGLPALPFWSV